MTKPAVVLIGADKGGVGKTTVARTLLDYFAHHQVAHAHSTPNNQKARSSAFTRTSRISSTSIVSPTRCGSSTQLIPPTRRSV